MPLVEAAAPGERPAGSVSAARPPGTLRGHTSTSRRRTSSRDRRSRRGPPGTPREAGRLGTAHSQPPPGASAPTSLDHERSERRRSRRSTTPGAHRLASSPANGSASCSPHEGQARPTRRAPHPRTQSSPARRRGPPVPSWLAGSSRRRRSRSRLSDRTCRSRSERPAGRRAGRDRTIVASREGELRRSPGITHRRTACRSPPVHKPCVLSLGVWVERGRDSTSAGCRRGAG
jgi:hypothetical protein